LWSGIKDFTSPPAPLLKERGDDFFQKRSPDMLNNGKKWLVVYTAPRAEKKANKYLTEKGIDVFLPLQKRLKQWSDRKKWVEEPLFPSYLFVNIIDEDYNTVLNTPGISKYIYFEGKAATISEKQINLISQLISDYPDIEVSSEKFNYGEKVKIQSGSLAGIEGELVDFRGEQKVLLRIDKIDYSLLVNIPASRLKKMT
jgi:transcriptional antiterminator RfaH